MNASNVRATVSARNYSPNLSQPARALCGNIVGQQVVCPGPGHSPRDRSLSVRPSEQSPFGFVVFSHAGDDWRECCDYVISRLGLPPVGERRSRRPQTARAMQRIPQDDGVRTANALRLWREALHPCGTPAWAYLARRGVALDQLPPRIHEALRWHPRCPWGAGGTRHGYMVALWTDALTCEPRAIHHTAISPAGIKVVNAESIKAVAAGRHGARRTTIARRVFRSVTRTTARCRCEGVTP